MLRCLSRTEPKAQEKTRNEFEGQTTGIWLLFWCIMLVCLRFRLPLRVTGGRELIVHHHGTVACKSPSFLLGDCTFRRSYVRTAEGNHGREGRQSPVVSLSALLHSPALLSMPCIVPRRKSRRNCIIRLEKSLRRSQAQAGLSGVTSEGQP